MAKNSFLLAACAAALLGASTQSWAQNIEMRYSNLFSKLKHNVESSHPDVQIALYLIDQQTGQTCVVHKGWMQKEEHYEALVIPADNALVVPLDNNLRQANPDVTFVINDGIVCDLSMQVIAAKPFGTSVTKAELVALLPQMDTLLSDLGGMFSSWFMPEVTGVVLHFNQGRSGVIEVSDNSTIAIQDGKAIVNVKELPENAVLRLPYPAEKVTPWLASSSSS
ncbi:DUF2987 domain-containing protein [Photobacterium galatheae]|uniref:DUF2987 domain-containing protein n=1 Tax=Photobacterium galatheae TaxID=1654360 RepID=A0A066RM71_9GAMM|nr:DUF2987 domain-containing protein [Photobacterium galatheae]KDM91454.1 hypothetical protein EA58_10520 [Photobacterium galatheae]MCM0149526.1 DUF2987 domain-containing protein [Photobacterium galatheae]